MRNPYFKRHLGFGFTDATWDAFVASMVQWLSNPTNERLEDIPVERFARRAEALDPRIPAPVPIEPEVIHALLHAVGVTR